MLKYNPKVFYGGVGTAFPLYKKRFGAAAEGVISLGGMSANDPAIAGYIERHTKALGQEPDRWASVVTYASLQALAQAVERAGSTDRKAVNAELAKGGFDTILGKYNMADQSFWKVGQWQNGEFVGVAPTGKAGASRLIFPKPQWQ